jgi:hypothetical protein
VERGGLRGAWVGGRRAEERTYEEDAGIFSRGEVWRARHRSTFMIAGIKSCWGF